MFSEKSYNSNTFDMIVTRDPNLNKYTSMEIVYNENQNLKSSNLYTVPTINMNAEEKDNLERPIEEP